MDKLIVQLDGANYSTWKLQVKMLLISLNLWNIVEGTERSPVPGESEAALARTASFNLRRGKALSTLVLALNPSMFYLIGQEVSDPVVVWKKLEDHFQRSTWSNQFSLRKRLYSSVMSPNSTIGEHIRTITEIFDSLAAVGDVLTEKDRVMVLMSSLPNRFDVLITALQSSKDAPSFEELVEKLKAEEDRQTARRPDRSVALNAVGCNLNRKNHFQNSQNNFQNYQNNSKKSQNNFKCNYCKQPGHFKRDCPVLKRKLSNHRPGGSKAQIASTESVDERGFMVSASGIREVVS